MSPFGDLLTFKVAKIVFLKVIPQHSKPTSVLYKQQSLWYLNNVSEASALVNMEGMIKPL